MSERIACSRGCWICDQRGDLPESDHSGGCCGSTLCDSSRWNKQVEKWLAAEDRYKARIKKNQDAMTVRWLIAESIWKEEQAQKEQANAADVEAWLAAEQEFRSTLTLKAPKRVHRERNANSPQIAAKQRAAAAVHGR